VSDKVGDFFSRRRAITVKELGMHLAIFGLLHVEGKPVGAFVIFSLFIFAILAVDDVGYVVLERLFAQLILEADFLKREFHTGGDIHYLVVVQHDITIQRD
jgi:hypothetical protein